MRGLKAYQHHQKGEFEIQNHQVIDNHHVAWVKSIPSTSKHQHFKTLCECDFKGEFLKHGIWMRKGNPCNCKQRQSFLSNQAGKFGDFLVNNDWEKLCLDAKGFCSSPLKAQEKAIEYVLQAVFNDVCLGQEFGGSVSIDTLCTIFSQKNIVQPKNIVEVAHHMQAQQKLGFDTQFVYGYYQDPNTN